MKCRRSLFRGLPGGRIPPGRWPSGWASASKSARSPSAMISRLCAQIAFRVSQGRGVLAHVPRLSLELYSIGFK